MIMIMMSINILFMFMNHPMSMGLTLIMQTIIIGMISGMKIKMFWMSYILLITMLSGMLVLFIYMSTMASNEKFKSSMKLSLLMVMFTLISMLFLFLPKKMIIKNNYFGMEMIQMKSEELFFLNKMFNMENMFITTMLVIYLFVTMIVSTHLVNISEGPMRIKI